MNASKVKELPRLDRCLRTKIPVLTYGGYGGSFPMGHGAYSSAFSPWVMGCTVVYCPMGHGAYGGTFSPWVMGHTVTYLSMGHGPYGGIFSHGSWGICQYTPPMGHGPYASRPSHGSWGVWWYFFPWVMGRTPSPKHLHSCNAD